MDETMEKQEYDFDEFFEADGDHTEPQEEETEDTSQEPAEDQDSGNSEEEPQEEEHDAEVPADGEPEPSETPALDLNQTVTLKVDSTDRTVTLKEALDRAQMGYSFERVKQQRDESRQALQQLQEQVAQNQGFMDLMHLVSERSNMSLEQLAESMYINMQKSKGIDEAAARETLRADKLQRELTAMKNASAAASKQSAAQARVERELSDFDKKYEGIRETLTKTQIDSMAPDIREGMSFTHAYEKMKAAEQLAEANRQAEALRRQMAAAEQNKKNRAKSPGSLKDSGGKSKKDTFDDFYDAFE